MNKITLSFTARGEKRIGGFGILEEKFSPDNHIWNQPVLTRTVVASN